MTHEIFKQNVDDHVEAFTKNLPTITESNSERTWCGGKVTEKNPLRIVTWFWNDPQAKNTQFFQWTPDHVHKLAAGFKRHLHMPHEFCVVTDRGSELDASKVRIIPMWEELRDWKRCFTRLRAYGEDMLNIIGALDSENLRFVSVDLDTLIVDDVTPIFDRDEPYVGYRDSKNPKAYSGALWMKDHDAYTNVWDSINLVRSLDLAEAKYVGSDQAWQSTIINGHSVKPPKWSWEDGIYDFWNIEGLPALPENARIVFFNGMRRDMSMPDLQEKYPWINENWVEGN